MKIWELAKDLTKLRILYFQDSVNSNTIVNCVYFYSNSPITTNNKKYAIKYLWGRAKMGLTRVYDPTPRDNIEALISQFYNLLSHNLIMH